MKIEMTKNERIAKIREVYCNNSNEEFAHILGYKKQYASVITKNGKNVGSKVMEHILSKFPEVSDVWLILGKGEMNKKENPNKNSSVLISEPEIPYQLVNKEEKIIYELTKTIGYLTNSLEEEKLKLQIKQHIIDELLLELKKNGISVNIAEIEKGAGELVSNSQDVLAREA